MSYTSPGHDRWLLTTSRAPFGVGFVPRYSPQLLTTRGWGFICQLVISASNKSGSHNAVDEKLPNVYYFLHAIHVHRTCIRPRYCVPLTLIILCEIWLKLLWFVSFHSTTIYIVGKQLSIVPLVSNTIGSSAITSVIPDVINSGLPTSGRRWKPW